MELSDEKDLLPSGTANAFEAAGELPALGGAKVSVIDPLDKVHPVSGKMIPEQSDDYRRGNHLFSAARRLIRLPAAKGETVAFQILFENWPGPMEGNYNGDYWALGYFGVAFREGVHKTLAMEPGGPKTVFRADISRPEWQRDLFDDILDSPVPLDPSSEMSVRALSLRGG